MSITIYGGDESRADLVKQLQSARRDFELVVKSLKRVKFERHMTGEQRVWRADGDSLRSYADAKVHAERGLGSLGEYGDEGS